MSIYQFAATKFNNKICEYIHIQAIDINSLSKNITYLHISTYICVFIYRFSFVNKLIQGVRQTVKTFKRIEF